MAACTCKICDRGRRVGIAVNDRNPDDLIEMLEELEAELTHIELDNEYYELILSGTWPQAEEILLASLEKIRQNKPSVE